MITVKESQIRKFTLTEWLCKGNTRDFRMSCDKGYEHAVSINAIDDARARESKGTRIAENAVHIKEFTLCEPTLKNNCELRMNHE